MFGVGKQSCRRIGLLATTSLVGTVWVLDETKWYRTVRRSFRAAGVGMYTIVKYKFLWSPENAHEINRDVAAAITNCCLENEGLYVKIGQAICSMAAVLPKEYTDSLSRLLDKAKTYEWSVIEKLIVDELGPGVVTNVETEAVGSASLAQVHRGLHVTTGQVVAIKVRKPNVSIQAKWDLAMYRFLLKSLEWTFDIPLSWSVNFTCSHFMDELDFRREAANSELTRSQLADNAELRDIVYVPRVIAATEKILLTEWVEDTVMINNVKGLRERGFDCKSVIMDATKVFGFQIFKTGHVHCDPHPGNLLIRQNPNPSTGRKYQIVLIDHGLYVNLPTDLRKQYAKLWVAMTPPKDQGAIEEICSSWGIGSVELFQTIVRAASRDKTDTVVDPSREMVSAKEKNNLNAMQKGNLIKQHLQKLLQDTSKFPKELILIGRCMNYIRAANWTHGTPIDRVAVLAECAKRSVDESEGASRKSWWIPLVSSVMRVLPGGDSYHREIDHSQS